LAVGYVENLKRMLRKRGYSIRAVEEILKWYEEHGADR